MKLSKQYVKLTALTLATLGVYTVGTKYFKSTPANAAQMSQPAAVTVQVAEDRPLQTWNSFSGRLSAIESVEIRPQVRGKIVAVLFDEGQIVEQGSPLFKLDERPYTALRDQAQAALEAAKTEAHFQQLELERARSLLAEKAVARSVFDQHESAERVARTNVAAAEARLEQANLDLEFATIVAPVRGRVSRAEKTVGNIVEAGAQAPLLTTLVSVGTIYAEFDVDEGTYRALARSAQNLNALPVQLRFPEQENDHQNPTLVGKIKSFDNRINTDSGTIRVRAEFPNENAELVPGMYAAVSLAAGSERNEILVPERSVRTDQDRRFMMVVNAQSKVEYRPVVLGEQIGAKRVVRSGLKAGERFVTNGMMHVGPESLVSPVIEAS